MNCSTGAGERLDLHVDAAQVLALLVLGAPLADLLVDHELPGLVVDDRVERVLAGVQVQRPEHQHLVGLEDGRLVGASAPHLTGGDQAAEDLAALGVGAAVGDGHVAAVDGGLDGLVRAGALLLGSHQGRAGHGEDDGNGRGNQGTTMVHGALLVETRSRRAAGRASGHSAYDYSLPPAVLRR